MKMIQKAGAKLSTTSQLLVIFGLCIGISSCEQDSAPESLAVVNWEKRAVTLPESDSLLFGSTYLSVYSQIYSRSESRTHDLTATVSLRNTGLTDSIYILKANYYNTKGELIRTYFNNPEFIAPMETIEIVISEVDNEGGTGANFVFDWAVKAEANDPLFDAVMISTSGQQGISFTTQGVRIQ